MVLPYENEDYGEVGAKNMSELGDVTLTSVTTGDLIKYDGSNFINFTPTYLVGADKVIFAVRGTGAINMNNIITSWRTPVINIYPAQWNSGTGTYTIPTTGNYRISFRTTLQNTGDSRSSDVSMFVNGSLFTYWSFITSTLPPGTPEYYSASIDFIDAFNLNDTFYFRGFDTAGLLLLDNAFLSITKIY